LRQVGGCRPWRFAGQAFLHPQAFGPCRATLLAHLAGKGGQGDGLAKHLGQQLIRRRLAVRVDRMNNTPLPGSKRLVKFPRMLLHLPDQQASVRQRRLQIEHALIARADVQHAAAVRCHQA
jgi:hypothetical protein